MASVHVLAVTVPCIVQYIITINVHISLHQVIWVEPTHKGLTNVVGYHCGVGYNSSMLGCIELLMSLFEVTINYDLPPFHPEQ